MRELKVTPIKNGTVIDHLPAGSALKVCQVLGIPRPGSASTVSVVLNVPSDTMGQKDLVKVEDRDLREEDLSRLAVLAPDATVNTIREYQVAEKTSPKVPARVTDLVPCPNRACVTHDDEPVVSEFEVKRNGSHVELSCAYCVTPLEEPLEHVPW